MDFTYCNPRHPLDTCPGCRRFAPHLPHLAECRPSLIVIDASVVRRAGQCPMFESSPVAAADDLPLKEAA